MSAYCAFFIVFLLPITQVLCQMISYKMNPYTKVVKGKVSGFAILTQKWSKYTTKIFNDKQTKQQSGHPAF